MKWCLFSLIILMTSGCFMSEQDSITSQNPESVNLQQQIVQPNEQAKEQFRPQYHFTPEANWMNDPNGLVYYDGEYHLFYQHHPEATVWGPMHWGHAVSQDLVNWERLPIALYPDELGWIFSGSAVVDYQNTSNLGSVENPPMVAIFTYHNSDIERLGRNDFQSQGVAFSLDKGRTWEKYNNNPVLINPGIRDFRDPKISWHEPSQKWIMVLAQGDHIGFYSSANLLDWVPESIFGREWGSHVGIWECPDLVRVRVNGTDQYKYVLLVSVNKGAPNGGSGMQYFIGDFDGSQFTLDAESREFLNPLQQSPLTDVVFADFESDFAQWTVTGDAFGAGPIDGKYDGGQQVVSGYIGNGLANSFYMGDETKGRLSSENFIIEQQYINFYIGGGAHPNGAMVNLVVDSQVARTNTGRNSETLHAVSWDVSSLLGQTAHIEIVDEQQGGWGHILADHFVFSDTPAQESNIPAMWLDYGTDIYAGITFSDVPESDGRVITMAWMSNWDYANKVPSLKWRSAMTVPRSLALQTTNSGLRLFSNPVQELSQIVQATHQEANVQLAGSIRLFNDVDLSDVGHRLTAQIERQGASNVTFTYANERSESLTITLDYTNKQLLIDRVNSGNVDFDGRFASVQIAPISADLSQVKVDILYDDSSIEVFVNEGELAMTMLVFPSIPYDRISANVDGDIAISSLQLTTLDANIE